VRGYLEVVMSRTWVHQPYHVKAYSPQWRHAFRELHDHRFGPCDLSEHDPRFWHSTRCRIDWVWIGRNIHCGCKTCTGGHYAKQERRRQRYGWKRDLASLIEG
jgi:hypothetical protein